MLNKTIDDKSVCVCVCVLRIVITKDKILSFSNYNVRIHNLLIKFALHLKPCGGTPVSEHCPCLMWSWSEKLGGNSRQSGYLPVWESFASREYESVLQINELIFIVSLRRSFYYSFFPCWVHTFLIQEYVRNIHLFITMVESIKQYLSD
jgi:hypothetical protein